MKKVIRSPIWNNLKKQLCPFCMCVIKISNARWCCTGCNFIISKGKLHDAVGGIETLEEKANKLLKQCKTKK